MRNDKTSCRLAFLLSSCFAISGCESIPIDFDCSNNNKGESECKFKGTIPPRKPKEKQDAYFIDYAAEISAGVIDFTGSNVGLPVSGTGSIQVLSASGSVKSSLNVEWVRSGAIGTLSNADQIANWLVANVQNDEGIAFVGNNIPIATHNGVNTLQVALKSGSITYGVASKTWTQAGSGPGGDVSEID